VSGVVYGFLWILFRVLAWLLFRFRTRGVEHVPRRGGLLIAANHASYLDIPALGCGLPRRVAFLGRHDLFPVPGLRWTCQWLGWIPIRLSRLDRQGFGKAIGLIKEGKAVVIFPEGTRTEDGALRPGRPGIGVIVAETGCPVVPAYLAGTHDVLPPGAGWIRLRPITVTFGKPMDFTADAQRLNGKDFYRHVGRTVMARIAELGQVAPPAELPGEPASETAEGAEPL
jgi:1-acyl-sn-glycerol-3-phosphate acyltransferase